jgi:hypothetical protein
VGFGCVVMFGHAGSSFRVGLVRWMRMAGQSPAEGCTPPPPYIRIIFQNKHLDPDLRADAPRSGRRVDAVPVTGCQKKFGWLSRCREPGFLPGT